MKYIVHSRQELEREFAVKLPDGPTVKGLVPYAVVEFVSNDDHGVQSFTREFRLATDEERAAIANLNEGAEVEFTMTVTKGTDPKPKPAVPAPVADMSAGAVQDNNHEAT